MKFLKVLTFSAMALFVGISVEANMKHDKVTSSQIMDVQEALNSRGHSLTVDGKFGPQTKAALRDFQSQNNLTDSGMIDSETLSALQITDATESGRSPASVPDSSVPVPDYNVPSAPSEITPESVPDTTTPETVPEPVPANP
ncbi:MAG: peptidoglycan-binding protein [Bdellovibrionales bacterium]